MAEPCSHDAWHWDEDAAGRPVQVCDDCGEATCPPPGLRPPTY